MRAGRAGGTDTGRLHICYAHPPASSRAGDHPPARRSLPFEVWLPVEGGKQGQGHGWSEKPDAWRSMHALCYQPDARTTWQTGKEGKTFFESCGGSFRINVSAGKVRDGALRPERGLFA